MLQDEVANNVTHYALSKTISITNQSVDTNTFYVIYNYSRSLHERNDEGILNSLWIDQRLCAFYKVDSDLLTEMMRNEAEMINNIITERLTVLYPEGVSSEMQVSLTILTEFSLSLHLGAMKSIG